MSRHSSSPSHPSPPRPSTHGSATPRTLTAARFSTPIRRLGASLPSRLECRVLHRIRSASQGALHRTSIELLPPTSNTLPLQLKFVVDGRTLEAASMLESPVIGLVIDQLEAVAGLSCIAKIGKPRIPAPASGSSPGFVAVELAIEPLEAAIEEVLVDSATGRQVGRLEAIQLCLHFQTGSAWQSGRGKCPKNRWALDPVLLERHCDLDSFIHTYPLDLPIRDALQAISQRFIYCDLFKRLALIFNLRWRKLLLTSIPYQKSIAESCYYFYAHGTSETLREEINEALQIPPALDQSNTEARQEVMNKIIRAFRVNLFELQRSLARKPNSQVPRVPASSASELIGDDLPPPGEASEPASMDTALAVEELFEGATTTTHQDYRQVDIPFHDGALSLTDNIRADSPIGLESVTHSDDIPIHSFLDDHATTLSDDIYIERLFEDEGTTLSEDIPVDLE